MKDERENRRKDKRGEGEREGKEIGERWSFRTWRGWETRMKNFERVGCASVVRDMDK